MQKIMFLFFTNYLNDNLCYGFFLRYRIFCRIFLKYIFICIPTVFEAVVFNKNFDDLFKEERGFVPVKLLKLGIVYYSVIATKNHSVGRFDVNYLTVEYFKHIVLVCLKSLK